MKSPIWDHNVKRDPKQKFNPTREEIAEYTRIWLKNGGRIKKLEPEHGSYTSMAYYNPRYAEGYSGYVTA